MNDDSVSRDPDDRKTEEENEEEKRLNWYYRPYGPNCPQCGLSPCGCCGL